MSHRPSLRDRLFDKVAVVGECWEFTGKRDDNGYGLIRNQSKWLRASRTAYELEVGPIPEGHVIRHTCDNPPCIRPEHLISGTQRQNLEDMRARDRHVDPPAWRSELTVCKWGHEFTEANTKITIRRSTGRPRRQCRLCIERNNRARYSGARS